MSWKQTTGTSIIATRDIQPLELLLYEWNLVTGPRQLRYIYKSQRLLLKYSKCNILFCPFKYMCNPFLTWHRVGENLVCVECLKVLDVPNGSVRAEMQSCGMCEMPICSDQCQVILTSSGTWDILHTFSISRYITMIWNYLAHNLIFQVGVNHYTECQVFRNLGRKSSSYNELAFKLAAVVPLRLLIKIKNENPKGFSRLQFLLDSQMNSSSSFFQDDEISTKR